MKYFGAESHDNTEMESNNFHRRCTPEACHIRSEINTMTNNEASSLQHITTS